MAPRVNFLPRLEFPSIKRLLPTGVVTSPNYPGEYPSNLDKTHKILVEQGLVLSLHFTAFDTKDSGYNCVSTHLKITDGDGTTLMEKTCGSTVVGNVNIEGQSIGSSLPADVRSRTNVVNFFFKTDAFESGGLQDAVTGWSVSWSAISPDQSTTEMTTLQTTTMVSSSVGEYDIEQQDNQ